MVVIEDTFSSLGNQSDCKKHMLLARKAKMDNFYKLSLPLQLVVVFCTLLAGTASFLLVSKVLSAIRNRAEDREQKSSYKEAKVAEVS